MGYSRKVKGRLAQGRGVAWTEVQKGRIWFGSGEERKGRKRWSR